MDGLAFQVAEDEGRKLRAQVTDLQLQLSQSQSSRSTNKQQLEKLQQQLSTKINEIYEMNDRLADLLQATLWTDDERSSCSLMNDDDDDDV